MDRMDSSFGAAMAAVHEEKHRKKIRPSRRAPVPAALERAVALALSGASCLIDGRTVERAESRLAVLLVAAAAGVVPVIIGPDRETGTADLYAKARRNGHLAHRDDVRAVAIVPEVETCPAAVLARLEGQEIPYIGILASSRILVSRV